MFFYTISIAAAIFIIMIVVFRLLIHFYFCRRVSFRYPGEKLKGCPIWTHGGKKGNGEKRDLEENTIADSTQHISTENPDSNRDGETASEAGQQRQHFTNLFTATPPGN
jgi:hypothetical protein